MIRRADPRTVVVTPARARAFVRPASRPFAIASVRPFDRSFVRVRARGMTEKKGIRETHFPGAAGAFVRVTMHNFMCHANCVVELGPRINYITGENGSGKSAILTALSVALGAKMKSIGRSSSKSAKGMIKSGAHSAKIVVVMSNDGEDAFKPEVFGRSITVEKTLNNAGANSLKIKNERGETVGTKVDELHKLTDHFCIDVDNPITVMTQDMAKKFLHSGDDTKKYEFFIQATMLQDLQIMQTIARNRTNETKDVLNEHLENIPLLKREVDDLEHEMNAFERVQELRSKAIDFRNRLAWSKVIEKEVEFQNCQQEIEKFNTEYADCTNRLETAERAAEISLKEKEEFDSKTDEYNARLQDLLAQRRIADAEHRELGRRLQQVETDKLNEETNVKKLSKKVADTESKIQRCIEAQRGETTEMDRKLQALEDKLIAAKRMEVECQTNIAELKRGKEEKMQAQQKFARMKRAEESDINDIRKQISTLKQTASNKLVVYGDKMPRLVDSIKKRASQFSKPPLGPVGMLVSLQDQNWVNSVEECIGISALGAFLVATPQDMDTLRKLSKECGIPNLSISCVNFNRGRYQIPAEKVPNPSEFTTVNSIISCSHDVVFNYLVDAAQIERSVLMRDENTASSMFHRNATKQKQIGQIFTERRKIFMSGETVRNEAFRSIHQVSRLGTDPKAQIARLEATIESKKSDAQAHSKDEVAAMQAVRDIDGAIKQKEKEFLDCEKRSRAASNELQQAKLDADDTNTSGIDVSTLQEALDSLSTELSTHQRALKEAEENWSRAKDAFDSSASDIAEKVSLAASYKKEMEQHMGIIRKVEAEYRKATKEIEKVKSEIEAGTAVIAYEKERLTGLKEEAEEIATKVTKEVCDREVAEAAGDITLKPDSLLRMYESTKAQMRAEEGRHKRPLEEVSDELSDRRRKLLKLENGVGSSEKILHKLKAGIKKRQQNMENKAHFVAKNVSHRFNWHMTRKGHAGQVLVDYKKSTLTLQVKDGAKSKTITDTRSMSGGERSYSTLAFNLALGDESDSPFRAMDEFDVFMDAVNRRVSIETLLNFARENVDKQFLFITPQDISAVDATAEDIKIQKMRAARPE
jgi:chromosome segregation ATPase